MRLHHLSATAFGPFAGTVEVDFDDLSEAGLFLLTGATGAGKTSVLDAVCFALYGAVPGDRQSAKHLRCDHAPADRAPEVSLELTLRGRRLRVVRSPGWERPKKRGTGTTVQQPSVRVTERVDGAWLPRAARLDEAGDLLGSLVGLTLTQFCQVAMLPQGKFEAFLRADSASRQKLLQQLFRTGRFEDVERWLKDRRRELGQASAAHHELVADLVSRISEAAGTDLPAEWDLQLDDPLPWALGCGRAVADELIDLADRATLARHRAGLALTAWESGRELAAGQQQYAAALADHERLGALAEQHDRDVETLAAARRAASVASLHGATEAAAADLEAAELAVAEALDGLPAEADALEELERGALTTLTRARDAQPSAALAQRLRDELAEDDRRLAALDETAVTLAETIGARPALLEELIAEELNAREAAAAVPAAERDHALITAQLAAARDAERLDTELVDARLLLQRAVDRAQDSRDRWLLVREQRLHGLASELARELAVGADCPVCGSADHPHPAVAATDAPDAAGEKAAQAESETAAFERQARELTVQDLETRSAMLRERCGDATARDLEAAEASLAGLRAAAARLDAATSAVRSARDEQTALADREASLRAERSGLAASAQERRCRLGEVERRLADLLTGTGCSTLGELAEQVSRVAARCVSAREALGRRAHLEATLQTAAERSRAAARDAGFADLPEALSAVLDDADLERLSVSVEEHRAAVTRCWATLEEPSLREAAEAPPPDLELLDHHRRRAADACADLEARTRATASRRERIDQLVDDLTAACAEWLPVRSDLDLASRLASLVDGTSPDNRLRMSLAGYVLAWRLGQVVAAANERLVVMTDQRFSLEHTGRRGARETRGGLSLLVRDDWSGERRDPATLSGGETFLVSLALALGLADVIAHEAGGAELDTLFVDEGFGSLDAETLDRVMGTLDSLRDGGRVVGVVSHVAEMRDRIPAQLHVRSRRDGTSELVRGTH